MAAPAPIDPEQFRRTIARWVSGVAIVTGRHGSFDVGLTVNSIISVALRPPTLLISLSETADSTPVIERSGVFGVSLLTAAQRAVSERFARSIPSAEKFEGLAVHRGTTGVALLDGALATFECRVERTVPVADHHLEVGVVVAAEGTGDELPLTFFRSHYGEPAAPGTLPERPRGRRFAVAVTVIPPVRAYRPWENHPLGRSGSRSSGAGRPASRPPSIRRGPTWRRW